MNQQRQSPSLEERSQEQKIAEVTLTRHFRSENRLISGEDVTLEPWEQYLQNCEKYEVTIDNSILISLMSRWSILQPTKSFCEGCMLPLAGILETNDHVERLVLRGAGVVRAKIRKPGNGDSNARVLRWILQKNQTLKTLDLTNTGLSEDGLHEICEGMKENQSVTELNVSRNFFSEKGMDMLREVLEVNSNVKILDVSCNALSFPAINKLETSVLEHKAMLHGGCCQLRVGGNFVFEEILNALSHGIGFLMAIVQTVLLMSEASDPNRSQKHFYACLLFSVSLLCLFLSSTLYHSFFMMPNLSIIFQKADHCGIYMLIAGSYTPFLMIGLNQFWEAQVMCILMWIAFFCGTLFSIAADLNKSSTGVVELCFYLGMGLAIVFVWPQVSTTLHPEALTLLKVGGAIYIGGVIFFKMGDRWPVFHAIWHLCVLVASLCHWISIYQYIVVLDLVPPAELPFAVVNELLSASGHDEAL